MRITLQDKSVPQEALLRALKIYSPSEKASSCQMILQATHALLEASMHLCRATTAGDVRGESKEGWGDAEVGVFWTCFLIKHVPMVCRPSPTATIFIFFVTDLLFFFFDRHFAWTLRIDTQQPSVPSLYSPSSSRFRSRLIYPHNVRQRCVWVYQCWRRGIRPSLWNRPSLRGRSGSCRVWLLWVWIGVNGRMGYK